MTRRITVYPAPSLPEFLTKAQVAELTQQSPRTVDRRIDDGTYEAVRIGPRAIRIKRESVLALLSQPVA